MRTSWLKAAFVAVVTGGLLAAAAPAAAAPTSGFDDWSCRPSASHPSPVVLIHGLGGNGPGNFALLGPYLASAGYCAFTFTYGQASPSIPVGGTIAIADSAKQIVAFSERVRQATGAAKVDFVGHSEGAFQSLYIPKILGYAGKVHRVVAIAPPTHGTTFAGLVNVAYLLGARDLVGQVLNTFGCAACDQLIVGGAAVKQLTAGQISQPGVGYTILASRADAIVTPTGTAFVNESGVRNAYVQDTCPLDPVGHVGLAFDTGVAQMVANGLDPAHAKPVICSVGPVI
ncbi:esterase/lipase family protein [Fodinicola acaciae]|uniref:esterase/lipase family protein n=1 Tax=Fodinicola acaciae TaxID=2681555 RepID=UPI0013D1C092|nr:alpha/beta fold hydrolase [Fodinicola acaciae]